MYAIARREQFSDSRLAECLYDEGDAFADFVGPLGLPQHIERVGHVVLVGGGRGGATVILAMSAGRRAARAIGAYLQRGAAQWPLTASDVAAFVPLRPLGVAQPA